MIAEVRDAKLKGVLKTIAAVAANGEAVCSRETDCLV